MTNFHNEIYALLLAILPVKYLYMSRTQRHIRSQYNTTYEEPYAIFKRPTTTTIISAKIMETNEKTEGLRQESEIVCTQSTLVKNKETKGQEKT